MNNKTKKKKNLTKEKIAEAIEDGVFLADFSNLYGLKLRYEKSLKEENLSSEIKDKITKKLTDLNIELEKIEKIISKKKNLNSPTKEALNIYEEADKAFIEALTKEKKFK